MSSHPPQQGQQQQFNEQKYSAHLGELLSGPCSKSYWTRKSRMHTLEWELSQLEIKLLQFDVAFKFSNAKDLAMSAQKLFHEDNSNEKARQRIGQLFSVLLNTLDKQFSTELVGELSMDMLHQMFFYAFPEQRNSTKGSLQVYLVCAHNQPHALGTIATKLFAYYLGASAEFQRGQKAKGGGGDGQEEAITPMDAVLFYLFDSLVQANFGDLSIHNVGQIFQLMLRNCFADSMGRVPADFYAQSGIPCLAPIARPSRSWHFCLPVLAHLFCQRGLTKLAKALEPFAEETAQMTTALERAMADPEAGPELLANAEFVRLALCWAMASPIRDAQIDPVRQLVSVPANIFWVDPAGLNHFWVYNLEAEEEDSPAEIDEPQRREKTLRISPSLLQPIRLLNSLFSAGVGQKELACLAMPNAASIVLLALMASENWKRADELVKQFECPPPPPQSSPLLLEKAAIVRLQKLQIQIALRKLDQAFALCLDLLAEYSQDQEEEEEEPIDEFPGVIVAEEPQWVPLAHRAHLGAYLRLLLFHICWLAFAKCQSSSGSAKMVERAELFFLSLLLLAQSSWEQFGFGLFQQLVEHVANKDRFRCPGLLSHVANPVLLGQLLGLDHVQMDFSPADTNSPNYMEPGQICKDILEGRLRLSAEKSPYAILTKFLAENRQKMEEALGSL